MNISNIGSIRSMVCSGFYTYSLKQGDKIVYIGSTISPYHRIKNHLKSKMIFDNFDIEPCSKSEMLNQEALKILSIKPKYNKTIPINDHYRSLVTVANDLSFLLSREIKGSSYDHKIKSAYISESKCKEMRAIVDEAMKKIRGLK